MRQIFASPGGARLAAGRWRRRGRFMHLGVRQRLYLLVGLFALGCAALAATLLWLQEQRAWEARARQLQTLVDAGIGVLEVHKKLADTNVMPEADAKKRALEVISGMHF